MQECLHALLTSGVPSHLLPISYDGVVSHERHNQWIKVRNQTETSSMLQFSARNRRLVWVPGREDVLFGRRKFSSPANVLFHGLVQSHLNSYMVACDDRNGDKKSAIRKEIWNCIVRARDGRFLQQVDQDGGAFRWEQGDEPVALYKIGQALEFLMNQLNAKKKKNKNQNNGKSRNGDAHGDMVAFGDFMVPRRCWNFIHCETTDDVGCGVPGW